MGRGLARHKQMGGGEKYNLSGVQKMSRVAALVDMKYMRREFGVRMGTLVSRVAGRVHVVWDDDMGHIEQISEKDARYWVDTGRWRITPPKGKSIFSENMRTLEVAGSLTGELAPCNDEASSNDDRMGATPTHEGRQEMATSSAELAEKFGTDTKTLRKFLRSTISKENQPGQGGRYTFDAAEIKRLEKAWAKWSEGKKDKSEPESAEDAPKKSKKKDEAPAKKSKKVEPVEELEEDDSDDEPTEDDLDEIDDEELEDLEDLLDDEDDADEDDD